MKRLKKVLNMIRYWFHHTTVFWLNADALDNLAVFDKALSADEIALLCDEKQVYQWHHIAIIVKRFRKPKFYLDGSHIDLKAIIGEYFGKT